MANINIEKKESGSIWPWLIIGLIVLALLAWWFMGRDSGDDVVTQTPGGAVADTVAGTDVGTPRGTARPVNNFLSYVEDNRARAEAGIEHDYTRDGLTRLADALGELREDGRRASDTTAQAAQNVAALDGQLSQHLDQMRMRADSLQANETSLRHANVTRAAMINAASAMDILVERYYPNVRNEVQQVRQAATAVNQSTQLLEQKQRIQTFFDRAGTAVRQMALTDTDAARRAGVVPRSQTDTAGQTGQ